MQNNDLSLNNQACENVLQTNNGLQNQIIIEKIQDESSENLNESLYEHKNETVTNYD